MHRATKESADESVEGRTVAVTHRYPDVGSATSFSGRLQAGRIAITILVPVLLLASVALGRRAVWPAARRRSSARVPP
jgi:hypothetical protein